MFRCLFILLIYSLKIKTKPLKFIFQVSKFVTEYLRQDGVFVVHLVAVNAGDLMAAELTAGLFDCYIKDQYHLPDRPNTQNNATQNNVVNIV